jgi:sulfite dehydrogenase (cytochrome) subunit B
MKLTALFTSMTIGLLLANVAAGGEETIALKTAPGSELVTGRCIVCHSLDYIEMNAPLMNGAGWEKTVRKMIDKFGAPISDDEAKQIAGYLAKNYSE